MAIWCSLGSRLRPRSGDGMTDSQADVWGENIDRRQALSAGELRERRESNCKLSSREERDREKTIWKTW